MDEITLLKSEAYDLLAQIQQLQRMLDEKNQQIALALEQINQSSPASSKKSK